MKCETFTALHHTCPPTPLRYGDAAQWRGCQGVQVYTLGSHSELLDHRTSLLYGNFLSP